MKNNNFLKELKNAFAADPFVDNNLISIKVEETALGAFKSIFFPLGKQIEYKKLVKTVNKIKSVLRKIEPNIDWSGDDMFGPKILVINKGQNVYVEIWLEDN